LDHAINTYAVPNYAPRYEDVLGRGVIAPHIINLGPTWSFTPRSL